MRRSILPLLIAFISCRNADATAQTFNPGVVNLARVRNVLVSNDLGECSGVIIATNRVLTAKHCNNGGHLTVDFEPAKVIKTSPNSDLILLEAKTGDIPEITVGGIPDVGQIVFAVGNFADLLSVFTAGWVCVVNLDKGYIMTRPVIDVPGMSGSGLYDENGRLIGINNQYRVAPYTWRTGHGDKVQVQIGIIPVLAAAIPSDRIKEFLKP